MYTIRKAQQHDTNKSEKIERILEDLKLNDGISKDGRPDVWERTGTDKGTMHSYIGTYGELLHPYEDRDINFLEIGVCFGGSYVLWKNLLPKAKFALVDVHDQMSPQSKNELDENSNLFIMDAYTPEATAMLREKYPEGFDIIVEDGPHTPETQAYCLRHYLPLLKDGGLLVIEDLKADWWVDNLMKEVPEHLVDNVTVYDLRNVKNRADDIMFVLKK